MLRFFAPQALLLNKIVVFQGSLQEPHTRSDPHLRINTAAFLSKRFFKRHFRRFLRLENQKLLKDKKCFLEVQAWERWLGLAPEPFLT